VIHRRLRKKKGKAVDRELQAAKLLTSVSSLRAQREYRTSVDRLAQSKKVASTLAFQNAILERTAQASHNGRRR